VTIYGIDPIGQPGAAAGSVKPTPWLVDDQVTTKAGYDRVAGNQSALALSGNTTYPRHNVIPLRDFAPGNYLLTVEARSKTNAKAVASRQVVFAVVP
jgi:hypothetical protein